MVIAHQENQLTPMLAAEASVSIVRTAETEKSRRSARPRTRANSWPPDFEAATVPEELSKPGSASTGRISWTARKAWSKAASVYE